MSAHPFIRFFLTAKGTVVAVLLLLAIVAAPRAGVGNVLPQIGLAVAAAGLLDLFILRFRLRKWTFPSSAVISGLVVSLVLAPRQPWVVPLSAGFMAIGSKYLLRTRVGPVVNPAAFALMASNLLFFASHSWWGGLPDHSILFVPLLLVAGFLVTNKAHRFPQVLSFGMAYFGLFTLAALLVPSEVARIFREPFLNAALFLAFFMLTEPTTSPIRTRNQILFGVVVAVASFISFFAVSKLTFLLVGLLIGNASTALLRVRAGETAGRQGN